MQQRAAAVEPPDPHKPFVEAGLSRDLVAIWLSAWPVASGDFKRDCEAFSRFGRIGMDLRGRLPKKPKRNAKEQRAAELMLGINRTARDQFARQHAEALYRALTNDYANFVRAERLVYDAAALLPGFVPTAAEVAVEAEH